MLFSTRSLLAAAAVLCAAIMSAPTVHAQTDSITHNKKNNKGTITTDAMTPAEISLDMAGVLKKFPVNEITKVAFAEDPTELTSARNLIVDQKNYNSAKDLLDKLDPAKAERDFVKQDIMYYKAFVAAKLALTEGGNKNDAASAMFRFYSTNPKSYHFYEAAEILG
ncbi:MAG: hypothetical protein K8R36_10085, partial [Planctomycetales bacterium]|nr:hypothetical protein [Planctomycetales bacterium]